MQGECRHLKSQGIGRKLAYNKQWKNSHVSVSTYFDNLVTQHFCFILPKTLVPIWFNNLPSKQLRTELLIREETKKTRRKLL